MSSQHHATPEQWQAIEANNHLPTRSTILELRDRVEALEVPNFSTILDLLHRVEALEAAAQPAQPDHQEKPGSSLAKQVEDAFFENCNASYGFHEEARAAIREVAKWLRARGYHDSPRLLEREVER